MNPVVEFASLYAGNTSAYGGDEGLCIKRPLTLATYANHLGHGPAIGVYPIRVIGGEAMVRWCGTDVDIQDYGRASAFATALTEFGVFAHIERSRSKGFHVLVFLSEWTPAVVARHAMLYVHDISGVPPIEPYPKQLAVSQLKSGLGNYLRLPYPGGLLRECDRQTMLWNQDEDMSLYEFLQTAKQALCAPTLLESIAECYEPPVRPSVDPGANGGPLRLPDSDAESLARKAGALAHHIWHEGPSEGSDRSTTMARLAHVCAKDGKVTPLEVFKILSGFAWNKFADRADHDEQLTRMIEHAFA